MNESRIKELRERLDRWDVDLGETKNEVEECLTEVERLRAEVVGLCAALDDLARCKDALEYIAGMPQDVAKHCASKEATKALDGK